MLLSCEEVWLTASVTARFLIQSASSVFTVVPPPLLNPYNRHNSMHPSSLWNTRPPPRHVLRERAPPLLTSDDPSSSSCASTEQQTSMATTVAVSPSEYLQPSTASTQVSRNVKQVFVSLSGETFKPVVTVLQPKTSYTEKKFWQSWKFCSGFGSIISQRVTNIYKHISNRHAVG